MFILGLKELAVVGESYVAPSGVPSDGDALAAVPSGGGLDVF